MILLGWTARSRPSTSAGDHLVVIGRVHACEAFAMRRPLLFFRGGFGVERPEDEEE